MKRIFVLLALLTPIAASAHDFWIEPATFRPAVGAVVSMSLRVGQNFVGDPVGRDARLTERFIAQTTAGEQSLPGRENRDPAGFMRVDAPGLVVVGYRSRPSPLELTPEKFNESLRLEGLERIIELRARRGESQKPDREIFSRCAKAILIANNATGVAGNPSTATRDKILGFRLELVMESESSFRLLFEGKPLAGALVTALQQDDPSLHLSARSDRNGRVNLALTKSGVWLVKSVHMIPAPADSGADWESLWASLTFER